jgi:hypothetical protein
MRMPTTARQEGVADTPVPGLKGPKLGLLLGAASDADVLLAGDALAGWEAGCRGRFGTCTFAAGARELDDVLAGSRTFGLVVWALREPWPLRGLDRRLRALRARLAPGGALVLFAENRWSLRSAASSGLAAAFVHGATAMAYRRTLRRAGFPSVELFLPAPGGPDAEEYVHARHGRLYLPSYASRLERLLHRLRLFPLVNPGFLFIASPAASPTAGICRTLSAAVTAGSPGTEPLHLERFDLRHRGALVLLLRTADGRARFVARIAASPDVDTVISSNALWTERLRALPAAANIRDRIPAPAAVLPLAAGRAYMEELVPGVVAWKISRIAALEPVMFAGMVAFARDLVTATSRTVTLDPPLLHQLLDTGATPVDAVVAPALARVHRLLWRSAAGQRRLLAASHGDYGYGNAIADPRSGQIRGIIDWDQAREDIVGVDLLHFLVQRVRVMHAAPLPAAFRQVAEPFLAAGYAGADARLLPDDAGPAADTPRAELLAWLALRFTAATLKFNSAHAERVNAGVASMLEWVADRLEGESA